MPNKYSVMRIMCVLYFILIEVLLFSVLIIKAELYTYVSKKKVVTIHHIF